MSKSKSDRQPDSQLSSQTAIKQTDRLTDMTVKPVKTVKLVRQTDRTDRKPEIQNSRAAISTCLLYTSPSPRD